MKIISLLFVTLSFSLFAQDNYNLKKGFVAEGYDVVAYFDSIAIEGKDNFTYKYGDVKLKFSSEENRNKFIENPDIYMPEYGGWCAYAIAVNNKKVNINPETFEIRNGKLYLFYNAFKTNTLELWLNKNPEELVIVGNENWEVMILSK